MPILTPEQGHIDIPLTDFMTAYMNDPGAYVAGRIGTPKPVKFQTGSFFTIPKNTFFRTEAGPRPLGGPPRERTMTVSSDTYACKSVWLATKVDDETLANATPPVDPEQDAIELLATDLLQKRERDFAAAALVSTPWTTKITGTASSGSVDATHVLQWDQSGSLPGIQIRSYQNTVEKLTGRKPNVLVLGADIAVTVTDNPDFQDKVKYTGSGGVIADASEMARYFGVEEVIIAHAVKDTSDTATSFTGSYIMDSKSALLVYRNPSPGLMQPSALTIFQWTDLLGNGAYTPGIVSRGRNDEAHSNWFHGAMAYDIHVTGADLGVFFSALQA